MASNIRCHFFYLAAGPRKGLVFMAIQEFIFARGLEP
jgi:hypothetical protein